MVEGAAGISQQWQNSTFRLPLTLRLPHGSIKEIKGGGGGRGGGGGAGGGGGGGGGGWGGGFISFLQPSSALFPPVPWLLASVPEPLHCLWFLLPRACSCLGPFVPVPYSHPRPEPSDLSPETCPSAPSPVPAVLLPPLQPTASAAAIVAAQSRRCRALVQLVRAQYTTTPSRALSPVLPVRLDRRHGPYSRWLSLQAQG